MIIIVSCSGVVVVMLSLPWTLQLYGGLLLLDDPLHEPIIELLTTAVRGQRTSSTKQEVCLPLLLIYLEWHFILRDLIRLQRDSRCFSCFFLFLGVVTMMPRLLVYIALLIRLVLFFEAHITLLSNRRW